MVIFLSFPYVLGGSILINPGLDVPSFFTKEYSQVTLSKKSLGNTFKGFISVI